MSFGRSINCEIYSLTVEADYGLNGAVLEWDDAIASILITHKDGPKVEMYINDSENSYPLEEGDTLTINHRDLHIRKVAFAGLASGGEDSSLSVIVGVFGG